MAVETGGGMSVEARRNMVDCQIRPSDVTRLDLIEAMLWAPREFLLPKSRRATAYVGEHIEIASGRYELDPRVLAKMIDATKVSSDDLVLVVGGGYGYAAAIFSRLAAAVISLEEDAGMSQAAQTVLAELSADNVISAQGALSHGCADHAPYDVILVNGAVSETPGVLIDQLADGGRLTQIRMSGAVGQCETIVKSEATQGARRDFDATAPLLPGFQKGEVFEL
ncbi:MAG: protein-L-isoaspartate O-methyltransferase [Pseudomonadota bacterium]